MGNSYPGSPLPLSSMVELVKAFEHAAQAQADALFFMRESANSPKISNDERLEILEKIFELASVLETKP